MAGSSAGGRLTRAVVTFTRRGSIGAGIVGQGVLIWSALRTLLSAALAHWRDERGVGAAAVPLGSGHARSAWVVASGHGAAGSMVRGIPGRVRGQGRGA